MSTGASHTPVNHADVAGAIGSYFGVISTDSRIQQLLGFVIPDVERVASHDPKGSWKAGLNSVIQKYEGIARELGLGVSQTQRDIEAARHANRTDATFAAAAGRLGWDLLRYASTHGGNMSDAGGGDGTGRPTSGSGDRALAALSRDSAPLSATGAVGYAKELGINPGHAGFFVGASPEMRNALRDAIQKGKPITDEQIKNSHDVSAVIGAIRAGKLKPDDPRIPPSVRQIIDNMKKQGIDPTKANHKDIEKYLKEHPDELKVLKAKNAKDIDAQSHLTDDEKANQMAAAKKPNATAPVADAKDAANKAKAGRKASAPTAPTKTQKLNV